MIPRPEYVNNYIIKFEVNCTMSLYDVHKKAGLFQKTMCCIVNEICPARKIRVREDNPKWETDFNTPKMEPDRKSLIPTSTSLKY